MGREISRSNLNQNQIMKSIKNLISFITEYLNEWFYGPYCPTVEELKQRELNDNKKNKNGYTFVEMMTVITITFILLLVAGHAIKRGIEKDQKEIFRGHKEGNLPMFSNSDLYKPKLK